MGLGEKQTLEEVGCRNERKNHAISEPNRRQTSLVITTSTDVLNQFTSYVVGELRKSYANIEEKKERNWERREENIMEGDRGKRKEDKGMKKLMNRKEE